MPSKAIQDYYDEETAVCLGCGRNNPQGMRIRTYWDGELGVCRYNPRNHEVGWPGVVYGGLIAGLVDCHCIATAAAAHWQARGAEPEDGPRNFVTARLTVNYLAPAPMGAELVLKAWAAKSAGRKVVVECDVWAGDLKCATGEVVAVLAPAEFIR